MTTYKSEMIEFRAGRIIKTEAEWTANTNVYPEGIIAITSYGSNAGRTKVFDGVKYWSQLLYNSGGGGGAVTSDDVSDESILADPPGRPLTETLDAISQTFSDITTAVSDLTQALDPIPKVYAFIANQTGTNAPTVTVLNNTLGAAVVWTRDSTGQYTGTLAGAFPTDKTIVVTPYPSNGIDFANDSIKMLVNGTNNTLTITTTDGGAAADDMLSGAKFKVEVYP